MTSYLFRVAAGSFVQGLGLLGDESDPLIETPPDELPVSTASKLNRLAFPGFAGTTNRLADKDKEENEEVTAVPFEYSRLQSPNRKAKGSVRRFRLLHLLPGARQDDIACRLVHADLSQAVDQYEALSYVWGSIIDLTPIRINDGNLNIGKNLRDALLNIRHPDRARVLWVDAVCIDQSNIRERIEQVAMMRDIYRNAHNVVVYIGRNMTETRRAFAYLRALGDAAAELRENPRPVKPRSGPLFRRLDVDTSMSESVLCRDWWGRAWTTQEILLAKRATLVSGRLEMDWDFFVSAVNYGMSIGLWTSVYFGTPVETSTMYFQAIETLKALRSSGNAAQDLLNLLLHTRQRDASDARDKVFAVLGLVQQGGLDVNLEPDYIASVEDVYSNATRAVVEGSGNLDILGACYTCKSEYSGSLPSWVADWSFADSTAQPMMFDAPGERRVTHASRNTAARPRWEEGGRLLVARGHVVDTVDKLTVVQNDVDDQVWDFSDISITSDNDSDDTPISEIFKEMWEAMKGLGALLLRMYNNLTLMVPYLSVFLEWELFAKNLDPTNAVVAGASAPNRSVWKEIFYNTLCAGSVIPGGSQAAAKLYAGWMGTLAPIRFLRVCRVDKVPAVYRFLGLMGYFVSSWRSYGEFATYITHATERRLGSTRTGLLCLLPKNAQSGDLLVLLEGGRVPVVLRPSKRGGGNDNGEDHTDEGGLSQVTTFVGEAYVHGIMDGEAFRSYLCEDIRIR
jgi:hypothetical protein